MEFWIVELHCPDPEVVSTCKTQAEAENRAKGLSAIMTDIAASDMEGDAVYQTVTVLRPDGTRYTVS